MNPRLMFPQGLVPTGAKAADMTTAKQRGQPLVAIVSLLGDVPDEELLATAAEHIARYKLPKAFLRVEQVVRSPSGKADYRWAKEQVGG